MIATTTFLYASYLLGLALVAFADRNLLRNYIPSLGLVVYIMFGLTYGSGLVLWRHDPSSLFGYASASTVGSLDRLLKMFTIGILSLSLPYSLCRIFLTRLTTNCQDSMRTFSEIARSNIKTLSISSIFLILLGTVSIIAMIKLNLLSRSIDTQTYALESSLVAKLIVGSGVISRLTPVGFFLLPLSWPFWSFRQRFLVSTLLTIWQVLALSSGSRGLTISIPLYLLLGALCWQKLPLRKLLIISLVFSVAFLPIAEYLRIHREGDQSIAELKRPFEVFQIGKQIMGTSHEFYLSLSPADCRFDLENITSTDPRAAEINRLGVRSFPEGSLERWHVVGLYENCSKRILHRRSFEGFWKLPLGLIPSTIFPASPNLFDGQELSESLSLDLDLKPGEISYSTISIFADSWWRWEWSGVILVSSLIGIIFAFLQSVFVKMLTKYPLCGLASQFLVVTLVGTWINNTLLTMTWYLFWDLPKAWLILTSIFCIIRLSVRKPHLEPHAY